MCTVPNLVGVRTKNVAALWGTATGGAGFSGPITYNPSQLQRDISNFKHALSQVQVEEAFMPVVAPASVA